MASAAVSVAAGGASPLVHPLVLINVSDHFTRLKLVENAPHMEAFGLLLGTQHGRVIEVHNSCELPHAKGPVKCFEEDMEIVKQQLEVYVKVFPNLDVVGWYCTTASPEPRHVEAHRLLTSLGGENLVFMAVDMAGLGAKTLPVRVYETSLDASQGGAPLAVLVEAAFQLESGEAERVAIDHITHVVPAGLGNTANLISNLSSKRRALSMLQSRVAVLLEYLKAVESGSLAPDYDILRGVSALAYQLPRVDSGQGPSADATAQQLRDTLLVAHLAALTKVAASFSDLIDKFHASQDRRGAALRLGPVGGATRTQGQQ